MYNIVRIIIKLCWMGRLILIINFEIIHGTFPFDFQFWANYVSGEIVDTYCR